MTSHERAGRWRRLWKAAGSALRRGLLGKSGHEYMKQISASDEYWERALAAELGRPPKQLAKPEAHEKG